MRECPDARWEKSLALFRRNVTEQVYQTWFQPIVFEQYDEAKKEILLQVPSAYFYEYLEENFIELLGKVLLHCFGRGIKLSYRVLTDKEHNISQDIEADPSESKASQKVTDESEQLTVTQDPKPGDLNSQLNPHYTFNNYIEGDSNKLPYSMGTWISEHPNSMSFNPMFLYGSSGCGKTHLINAMGLKTKELYPRKRVLYISARLFQVQYTNAVMQGKLNEFIAFYQTIDMLIVDDIQEWMTAPKTHETFFHIFNHLYRNGKRIILASDRPPVDLKGLPDRMLTRFSCGLIAEMERPSVQLSIDILKSKIRRDGLKIPENVIRFIAETANGSVRDLQGVVNSLMAYSIVYNCDINMTLAERVIKRAVKIDDKPLTIDDILEKVCEHYNVTLAQVNSRSRKQDFVKARQVSMYLAQKYTRMPASRIGKLVGNRDHSTVIHSCSQVEKLLKTNQEFSVEIAGIEESFKLKG